MTLLIVLAIAWVLPLVALIVAVARAVIQDRREDAADAEWSSVNASNAEPVTALDFQRGNPRGVGRHDWPL